MKTADELFGKLGYKKIQDDKNWVDYMKNNVNITFSLKYKRVEATRKYGDSFVSKMITCEELQAIHKKCEELKWI